MGTKMILGTGWSISVHFIHKTAVIFIRTNLRPLFVWHVVLSFHIPYPQELISVFVSCKAAYTEIYSDPDTISCPLA